MIYTPELIKSIAPAVFATSPSPKMTNKYEFVPTNEVMDMFDREGWQLSSVKQSGRGIHGVHELKYRNGQLPKVGDTVVEAIIRNSHDGTATFSMGAGLFRLVCSNGLRFLHQLQNDSQLDTITFHLTMLELWPRTSLRNSQE